MIVYILTQEADYEGESVWGAYTTRALAEQHSKDMRVRDRWVIHAVEVDAPARYSPSSDAQSA